MGESTVRPGKGPYFAQVPFALLKDEDADAHTVAVYAALRSYADFSDPRQGAKVSDKSAAKRAGCSPRTFRDRRDKLQEMGWIEWESGKKDGRPNAYVIHASLEGGSVRDADPPRQETPTGSAGDADNRETVTRDSTTDNSRRGDDAPPLRKLADTDPDENGRLTRALTAAWVSLQPERPSESEIRKQGAVAKRLAKDHEPRRLALALYGMDRLFPHSDGEPWDLFDFERKFSKAASKGAEAARDGPTRADQKETRKYHETLDAIGGGR